MKESLFPKVAQLPEHQLTVLISAEEVQRRVAEMARQLSEDYRGQDPVLVAVLKGAFVFVADLIRAMDTPTTVEFIRVSSYGDQIVTSGEVKLELDLSSSIANRHVVLVEDIVDTGLTVNYLRAALEARNPKSLKICTLLHKPGNNVKAARLEYVGFNIPNEFVVGYGLDYCGYYRDLPCITQIQLGAEPPPAREFTPDPPPC